MCFGFCVCLAFALALSAAPALYFAFAFALALALAFALTCAFDHFQVYRDTPDFSLALVSAEARWRFRFSLLRLSLACEFALLAFTLAIIFVLFSC